MKLACLIIACITVLAVSTTVQFALDHIWMGKAEQQINALTEDADAAGQALLRLIESQQAQPAPKKRVHRGMV